jgi:hypothetical protein
MAGRGIRDEDTTETTCPWLTLCMCVHVYSAENGLHSHPLWHLLLTMLHALVKWTATAWPLGALTYHSRMLAINTVWLWAWSRKTFTALWVGAAVPGGTVIWQPVAISGALNPFLRTRDITAIYI